MGQVYVGRFSVFVCIWTSICICIYGNIGMHILCVLLPYIYIHQSLKKGIVVCFFFLINLPKPALFCSV